MTSPVITLRMSREPDLDIEIAKAFWTLLK